jgi:hypothetical protein
MPVAQPWLPGPVAPVRPGPASQESVCGQRSQPLHLLVNCSQKFRKYLIQLSRGGADHLVAETADSIIEAAQWHERRRTWRRQNIARFFAIVRYRTYCSSRLMVPTDCHRIRC